MRARSTSFDPEIQELKGQPDRTAKPAPAMQAVASQAGDSGLSVTVVMTLRVAPPS